MVDEMKNKITLVIVGRSGSGKGTQAKLLVEKLESFGVRHLETGQVLRDMLKKKDNPTAAVIRQILERGGFVAWWIAVYTWLKDFIEEGSIAYHLVFDGSPRKVLEAGLLDDVLDWHSRPLALCLYIKINPEEAKDRLIARKRYDDNPEAITNRLAAFEADVVPVIKYYEEKSRLLEINGEQTVEAVQEEIIHKLKGKLGTLLPLL